MEYFLEIYEPGSLHDVWVSIKSDSPFLSFSKGDIINTYAGANVGDEENLTGPNFKNADSELRVTQVEHIVWGTRPDSIKHRIMVFTEETKNRRQ
jgi:hypothetical protein